MVVLDKKDRRILYELEKDSRESDAAIAKITNLNKQTVRYRINSLYEKGIIKMFQTSINLGKIGLDIYGNIYFQLQNTTAEKEKEIINYLCNNKNVAYVASLGGGFDLSIVVMGKNILEFMEKLEEVTSPYPQLNKKIISLRVSGTKFNKKYLLDEKERNILSKMTIIKQSSEKTEITDIDMEVLKILTQNSRTSLVEISQKLKKPATTIFMHVRKLTNQGVISGFPLLLDLKAIDIQNYKTLITLSEQSEENEKKLISFCHNNPNITWFFKTIAPWNYEIRIEIGSQEEYQQVIKDLRTYCGTAIEKIETITVFTEHKEDYSTIFT
jgi:DNA-binding Lrp family transcriptional regulator